jgi:NhaP-type Na+/H+ or K+/H+ antiporter
MTYILQYDEDKFPLKASIMFGAIISATDPVAVVALLKELGASKKLATMIEGESLFNDGTAMVIFLIMLELVEGKDLTFGEMIAKFARLSFLGPLLGIVFGVVVEFILHRINNNYVLETNLSIVAAYLCWFVAENTDVHVSGILAIVAFGLYMSHAGKTGFSPESFHAMHHVWGYVGFCAETMIFMLAGIIMGIFFHIADDISEDSQIKAYDYLAVFLNYLMCHVIRFSVIFLFWPILNRLGYGMSFQ